MVFSSVFFLFFFLPLFLGAYFLSPNRFRNLVLLSASLLFYFWGEGRYVVILVLYMVCNYVFGLAIERFRKDTGTREARKRRLIFIASIIFNLGFLAYFKYFNFIIHSLNSVLDPVGLSLPNPPVHLPIGISFFSFQALSYVIDIYRGEISAQRSLINFSMYKALFPQLIAGPIVRYKDVASQVESRTTSAEKFTIGIKRFIIGLGKKVLIANSVGFTADAIFKLPVESLTFTLAWLGVACYAIQIYFDFSGYSDMAIGLGKMLGFDFLENFNTPYISKSIREFWRRWHISLSTWFRDYLYKPLGGNRAGESRTYLNLTVVFALCGLWHGASWTFLVWGLWHGLFLVLERTKIGLLLDKTPRPARHLYTLLVVLIGWVFFRSESFTCAVHYLRGMAGLQGFSSGLTLQFLDQKTIIVIIVGILASIPLKQVLMQGVKERISLWMQAHEGATALATGILMAGIFILCAMDLSTITYNPFIYFRF